MRWRFWKSKEKDEPVEPIAPPRPVEPIDSGAFAIPAPPPIPVEALEEKKPAPPVRRRPVRCEARGVSPVLIPSLREVALVYRQAAEARAELEPGLALEFFRAYLELCPDDLEAHFALGQQLLCLGQFEEAERVFNRVLEANPKDGLAAAALGYVLGQRGDWEGALAHHREACRLRPDSKDVQWALLSALERAGRLEEANELRHQLEAN